MIPLAFTWPYFLLFWPIYIWVFAPEFRIIRTAAPGAAPPAEDRGSLQVIMVVMSVGLLAPFLLAFFLRRATLPGERTLWFFLGLAVLVAGSLLRRHCFRVLGRFFTGAVIIQEDHRLIDEGAYRWVRHPSYSAGLLIVLGIGMALDNWPGLAIAVVLTAIAYTYRAHVEEQALLAKLGEPYARFLATRKRFVPYVW
jgi:protein-S-isoprenylcysteine O-methyltransferase Ste14